MSAPGGEKSGEDLVGSHEMAERLGVTTRHLQELRRRGVLESAGRGRWDVRQTTLDYIKYLRSTTRQGDSELQGARVKLVKAQAAKAEQLVRFREATQDESAWMVDFANTLAHHCFLCHQSIRARFYEDIRFREIRVGDLPAWQDAAAWLTAVVSRIALQELALQKDQVWNLSRVALARGIRLCDWQELNRWLGMANPDHAKRIERASEGLLGADESELEAGEG